VVLPAPVAPTSATFSPRLTCSVTSLSTGTFGLYANVTSSMPIASSGATEALGSSDIDDDDIDVFAVERADDGAVVFVGTASALSSAVSSRSLKMRSAPLIADCKIV